MKLTQFFDTEWEPLIFTKSERKIRPQVLGVFGLGMTLAASSTFPSFGKNLTTAFSPMSLLFLSEVLGGLFVILSFGLMPLLKTLAKLDRQEKLILAAASVLAGMLGPFLWFYGLGLTTAVNSALFSRAEMLFLILLSAVVLRETFTRYHAIAVAVIMLGISFVALQGFTVGLDANIGDNIIILASLIYAVNGVIVKKYLHGIHPEMIILARAIAAGSLFFISEPFLHTNLGDELHNMTPEILTALLAYGFIVKFLGIYGFYQAIDSLKVSTVSMVGTLSVVGSVLFAHIYLEEKIFWYHAVGGILLIGGVMISHHVASRENKELHEHHIRQHYRHHV